MTARPLAAVQGGHRGIQALVSNVESRGQQRFPAARVASRNPSPPGKSDQAVSGPFRTIRIPTECVRVCSSRRPLTGDRHGARLVAPARANRPPAYGGPASPASLLRNATGLQARKLLPFPPAVWTAQIVRRQAHQQHPRRPQSLPQSQLPVLATANFIGVEEDSKGFRRELAEILVDGIPQARHPATAVVGPGIADEYVILGRSQRVPSLVAPASIQTAGDHGEHSPRRQPSDRRIFASRTGSPTTLSFRSRHVSRIRHGKPDGTRPLWAALTLPRSVAQSRSQSKSTMAAKAIMDYRGTVTLILSS